MEREQLTELIIQSVCGCSRFWADTIAEHLLKNNVIPLPCKLGDTMHALRVIEDRSGAGKDILFNPHSFTVGRIVIDENGITVAGKHGSGIYGKTVFSSFEEALKAVEESGKNAR